MKKFISTAISLAIVSSVLYIPQTYADNVPTLYFKSGDETDIIKVSSEDVANGDVTVRIGIYIDDTSNDIANLQIKWACDSEYIVLGNLLSAVAKVSEETYTLADGTSFTTSYVPTCFGQINTKGVYSVQGSFIIPDKPDADTGRSETAYSIAYQSSWTAPVTWFGGDSDAYMISDFDAVISQGTPDGLYTIYYIESQDGEASSTVTHGAYYSVSKDFLPELKSITIQVGEIYESGDVNKDGVVNSSDASLVLNGYANFSSGNDFGFDDQQMTLADVTGDGIIDSSDASWILEYYANNSSGKAD